MICTTSYSISVMKTSISEQISPASSALSRWALLVACGLSALFGASCSVRRSQTSQFHRLDSVSERVEILQTPVALPETKATLRLPLSTLLDLPEGAGYHSRQGVTRIALTRRGDSLEATATTDSQTVLPSIEERAAKHITQATTTALTKSEAKAGLSDTLPWTLIAILIPIASIILWQRRK